MSPSITLLTLSQLKALKVNGGGCFGTGPGILKTNDGQLTFAPRWKGSYEFSVTAVKADRNTTSLFTVNVVPYKPPIASVR